MRLSPRSSLRFLLALAWLLVAPAVAAASTDAARWRAQSATLFTHYTTPVVSSGNAMAQDGSGFLWIGTQTGLVRWDGYAFRKFAARANEPGALSDGNVLALHTDRRGRLWIGTAAGGLLRFDAARDSFVAYPTGPGGLQASNVRAIADDGRGGFWIGSAEGLDHFDDQDAVAPSSGGDAAPWGALGGIDALLIDRSGTLWAGTPNGLLRRPRGASVFAAVSLPAPAGAAAPITQLFEDGRGRVWVATRGRGAYRIDPGETAARAVLDGDGRSALGGDTVLGIAEAAPGEIWFGTYGAGIVVVDPDGGTRRIRRHPGLASGLADDDILSLFRDRSGIVWVAAINALSRHDPQQQAVITLPGDSMRPEALRNGNVTFVLPRPNGSVWLGVGSDGIDFVDPLRGRTGQLRADADRPLDALPKARVLTMVAGPKGGVYIGTRNGMYRADAEGTGVRRIEIPGRDPTATVWSLCVDGGVLWVGGLDGLWALDASDPAHVRLLRHETRGGLGAGRIMSLLRGSGSDLWIGTGSGLFRFDTVDGTIDRLGGDGADASRFPIGMVSSLLIDPRGRLWLSAYGEGVWVLEPRAGGRPALVRRLGLSDGLPDAGVDKLLVDDAGRVWASTDDGLAVIDPDTFAIRALRGPQGVDILSYWTNAGAVTPAGELLFGGQGGLSVVRPGRLTTWRLRPPVVVTAARVGATPVPAGRLEPSLGPVRPLELPPAARGLALEFAALDFSAPEQNRYAYRLVGFDADWTPTDASHRWLSYTNLPPGDYTLEVRGSNRDGVWSEPPLALPIHVLPAWFQTAWFRGAAGVVGVLLVATLVQARTIFLRRRQRELEALVAVRTADLEQRSADLRESQRQLEKIAYADPLTGLPNRRGFGDDLRHQLAQTLRGGPGFALLLIDLDGFKAVNDSHGHDAGDALLAATAERLRVAVREADPIARLGGDEFAILLTQEPGAGDINAVCRRIVASLAAPLPFEGRTLRASASIGVASCPGHGAGAKELYKAADIALYEAKRAGRNTWRWFAQRPRPGTEAEAPAAAPPS